MRGDGRPEKKQPAAVPLPENRGPRRRTWFGRFRPSQDTGPVPIERGARSALTQEEDGVGDRSWTAGGSRRRSAVNYTRRHHRISKVDPRKRALGHSRDQGEASVQAYNDEEATSAMN